MVKTKTTYQRTTGGAVPSPEAVRVLISGGGTGGHVFPAIAIADAIRQEQPGAELLFVGAKGKLEMDRVPRAGYPIEGIRISGFQRKLTLRNLSFPFKLLASLWKVRAILKRFHPDVVVGVGGYASGPTLRVAQWMGLPTLIQEQNSYPGITNRLLAARAERICVAYGGMEQFFPASKIVFTGNPVRRDLAAGLPGSEDAKRRLGLEPEKPLITIIGGSLGARSLNEAMAANESLLRKRSEVQVLWQVGKLYEAEFLDSATARLPQVKAKAFLEDMPAVYAASEVIICRAGASTLSEVCLLGQAAVLVPSPNVAEDHQTKNARALADKGAARLVPDAQAAEEMVKVALELIDRAAERKAIEDNARKLGIPDAAKKIAKEVWQLKRQSDS